MDVYLSHAICAVNNKYTRPLVNESSKIRIVEGRHPVVEKFKKDISFIPNNTFLDHEKQRVLLITGPNMAGKSTYIRQVALIVLLAQIGCYVPALEAEIGIVDRLLARIGASDNLSAGKSTFMVEMSEMSYIIANATSKSLILLDEIGRGTSTYDGLSIAQSIIEYIYDLKKIGAKTLFATHYHELTSLASYLPGIVNFSTEINEDGENIVFLHKIVKGKADRSYGIHVAKLAGLPDNIVLRAQELLKTYEKRKVNSKEKIAVDHNTSYTQLSFTQESTAEKLLVEIRQLDLLTITPLEALNKINTWQKKIATDTTTE